LGQTYDLKNADDRTYRTTAHFAYNLSIYIYIGGLRTPPTTAAPSRITGPKIHMAYYKEKRHTKNKEKRLEKRRKGEKKKSEEDKIVNLREG
jgi:hypothetical protein